MMNELEKQKKVDNQKSIGQEATMYYKTSMFVFVLAMIASGQAQAVGKSVFGQSKPGEVSPLTLANNCKFDQLPGTVLEGHVTCTGSEFNIPLIPGAKGADGKDGKSLKMESFKKGDLACTKFWVDGNKKKAVELCPPAGLAPTKDQIAEALQAAGVKDFVTGSTIENVKTTINEQLGTLGTRMTSAEGELAEIKAQRQRDLDAQKKRDEDQDGKTAYAKLTAEKAGRTADEAKGDAGKALERSAKTEEKVDDFGRHLADKTQLAPFGLGAQGVFGFRYAGALATMEFSRYLGKNFDFVGQFGAGVGYVPLVSDWRAVVTGKALFKWSGWLLAGFGYFEATNVTQPTIIELAAVVGIDTGSFQFLLSIPRSWSASPTVEWSGNLTIGFRHDFLSPPAKEEEPEK